MKILTFTMSCMAVALACAALLGLMKSGTSVATFDVQRVRGQFIHQLALHKASQELVNTSSVSFKRKLQDVLDAYAHEKRVVILDGKHVLSSGKDVTEDIIPRLSRAMRGQS